MFAIRQLLIVAVAPAHFLALRFNSEESQHLRREGVEVRDQDYLDLNMTIPMDPHWKGGPLPTHRKPMVWLHISKAGGSTICRLSKMMGENVPGPQACTWSGIDNPPSDKFNSYHDLPERMPRHLSKTCEEREDWYKKHNITLSMIERPLEKQDYCPEKFMYGTIMRDPVTLASSTVEWDAYIQNTSLVNARENYRRHLACVEQQNLTLCKEASLKTWMPLWYNFDNKLIRWVLGPEVFLLPPGKITEEHARAAIEVLKKFDIVIHVETVMARTVRSLMRVKLGWVYDVTPKMNWHAHHMPFTLEEEKRIRTLNRLDYQVYNEVSKWLTPSRVRMR